MTSWTKSPGFGLLLAGIFCLTLPAQAATRFVQVAAKDKHERSAIANLGMSIEAVRSDSVWGFADEETLRELRGSAFKILGDYPAETGRGGHQGSFDFPVADARFHNYAETLAALRNLTAKHADISRLLSIGKSVEGRDIWALHINTSGEALLKSESGKPGAIFMGNHHAREHLSLEVPLMFAQYLLDNRADARIEGLLDSRDIWIIPMVNPDGVEFDIATGKYQMWRKNRRNNGDGSFGVDLNRNYGFRWGTGGSSKNTRSDVYMGSAPFSEPETQTIRDFVRARVNAKVLLSFHTFSELVLYPWGSTDEPIGNARDLAVFQKMARTMADWNGYKPQQSSDLYIASGDTTDWAYGELGIFAFTFELSPSGGWGGFYPGPAMIDKAFSDNLRPCLYLLDVAADPYRVLEQQPSGWLRNFVEPRLPQHLTWAGIPFAAPQVK
ncbi:MAG: M14 family metallopeptidase [Oligoflexia bacterium]|nr:M14 family metallopeptidase [Oligoflexia bacterium]